MPTRKKLLAGAMTAAATGAAVIGISVSAASSGSTSAKPGATLASTAAIANDATTATPIKHLVVLFDENVSFDHYFATYPHAANLPGEPQFTAAPNTPTVNGLSGALLTANPNADDPQRLGPDQALTCDQNHSYTPEQSAFDGGLMDQFVQKTTGGGCTQSTQPNSGSYGPNGIVMDYYDGNTVTALWNYAQHYTLDDNSYDTQFGPSTPGALNAISGNTSGAVLENAAATPSTSILNGTMNGDIDPYYDECSNGSATPSGPGLAGGQTGEMTGNNIGDELNTAGLTWGWFQGGFTPSSYNGSQPVCATSHTNIGGASVANYSPHHEPFQYYASTSNPYHLAPGKVAQVGTSLPKGINHQYDLSWFNRSVKKGDMPAVSYLKAPEYEDGHAGYSDPLDEQRFLVDEINAIQQSPDWASTAIVIAYDDSDGWYDHQMGPIIRGSQDAADTLNGTGHCGSATITTTNTVDRCGDGPRLPMLVISPWANQNFVDNTFTEQASIPRFIEDNWGLARLGAGSADDEAGSLMSAFDFDQSYGSAPAIILNDTTGEVEQTIPATAPGSNAVIKHVAPKSHAAAKPATTVVHAARAPKLAIAVHSTKRSIKVTVHTDGGSQVATALRMRIARGGHLVANQASRVRDHRATFLVRRGAHLGAGRYSIAMTVDAGGSVAAVHRSLHLG